MYVEAKQDLEKQFISQWTGNYPIRSIVKNDIEKQDLSVLKQGDEVIGAITLNEEQEPEYNTINWRFDDSKVLVIHRLVVHPKHQRKGYAKTLMDFVEDYAKNNGYTSIRLDAYTQNQRVIHFYKTRGYGIRGNVYFPERKHPFHCMEKLIK